MARTILRGDTLIVADGKTHIIYSAFQGRIARVDQFPIEGGALERQLVGVGFFAPVPERTKPVTRAGWTGFHSLTLLLTRGCNLACTYCYAKAKPGGPSMPKALALDALQWFADQVQEPTLRITFHGGGEPTLEQETIQAVVEHAELIRGDRRTQYLITTNGTAPRWWMDWMMAHSFGISISVDGPPDIQDRNRPFANGSGSSEAVEGTIRLIVGRGYPFTVRVTFSSADDVERIIRYFGELGVKSVHLEPLFPFGRNYSTVAFGKGSNDPVYAPKSGELVHDFLRAVDLCGQYGMRIVNSHLQHFTRGVGYFCGAASGRSMMVSHDGLLMACLEVVDGQDHDATMFTLGKWEPDGHRFSIDSEKLAMLQARHADVLPECGACFARYHCAGGCAVKAVRATGNFFDRDLPYCGFTRAIVPKLVGRIACASGV